MGAGHQKDQAIIRSLELAAPSLHPLGRGEDLEIESIIIGYAFVVKPS